MSLFPGVQTGASPGLFFDRKEGHQFRALTSHGGGYYWKPNFMAVIRRCPELARFLPSAEFTDSANRVFFTRYQGEEELLTKTVALSEQGVELPEADYKELQDALAKFKEMAADPALTPDESRFVTDFRLPDRVQFPGAYRVLRTPWYSRNRLFVLWGLEPAGDRSTPVIKILPQTGATSAQSSPAVVAAIKGQEDRHELPPPAEVPDSDGPSPPSVPVSEAGQSDRSRLIGCLWILLSLLLLVLIILLLSECAPASCEDRSVPKQEPMRKVPGPQAPPGDPESPQPKYAPGNPEPKKPELEPYRPSVPKPIPSPSRPERLEPETPAPPKWWKAPAPLPGPQKAPDRIIPIPDKAPKSPGIFEVYIRKDTTLIQKPPAAEIHLGLRLHGAGRIKDVTWILEDGTRHTGEQLDELVPFNNALSASTEIDVAFTYVDETGEEHKDDGFSFRYLLQGRISFEEEITDSPDKRTPEQKDIERKKESEKKAIDKGA